MAPQGTIALALTMGAPWWVSVPSFEPASRASTSAPQIIHGFLSTPSTSTISAPGGGQSRQEFLGSIGGTLEGDPFAVDPAECPGGGGDDTGGVGLGGGDDGLALGGRGDQGSEVVVGHALGCAEQQAAFGGCGRQLLDEGRLRRADRVALGVDAGGRTRHLMAEGGEGVGGGTGQIGRAGREDLASTADHAGGRNVRNVDNDERVGGGEVLYGHGDSVARTGRGHATTGSAPRGDGPRRLRRSTVPPRRGRRWHRSEPGRPA